MRAINAVTAVELFSSRCASKDVADVGSLETLKLETVETKRLRAAKLNYKGLQDDWNEARAE
jgi:hypothetical protein